MARKSRRERRGPPKTSGADRAASALGVDTHASRVVAKGSDETRRGMDLYLEDASRKSGLNPEQAKGFSFEHTEVAKFNTDAANKGLPWRARVRGDNHPQVDVEVVKGETVLERAQLKTGPNAHKELEKYPGVRRVTTKGGADPQRGVEDELAYGGASSGGTTAGELEFATRHPDAYATLQELGQVGREAAVAGMAGAASGAIFGGALSTVVNLAAVAQGEKTGKEAAKAVAEDTIRSSGRAGAATAGSAVVRHVGHKVGLEVIKKANVATAVASGLVDVSATVWSWVTGKITSEEAAIRLGDTGCGALSGIYGGATAGAIFGPVGAAVGSAVGYLLAACVYQSCVATFQRARLAEEEAERAIALCAEAVRRMDEQRRQFERDAAEWLDARQNAYDRHFKKIDAALAGGDPKDAAKSLSRFAASFGRKLRHVDFGDFQRFMESKEPVVL